MTRKATESIRDFLGVLSDFLADASGANAKRTLCCNVKMWDVWMHDQDKCPQAIAARERYRAWREASPDADPILEAPNFVPPQGFPGGMCEECGYPTGLKYPDPYVAGAPCPYCGYVEKRKPKP